MITRTAMIIFVMDDHLRRVRRSAARRAASNPIVHAARGRVAIVYAR
jgi:hypothetical protein